LLPTEGVSGTAKMRLLTVSLRENRLANPFLLGAYFVSSAAQQTFAELST
jgi:hypothetical protein